jgi:general secretion pathway protein K
VRRRASPPRRQRGIAIITAMLVVTIATVLAVELAWETNLDLRRTESLFAWEQARQYGYGAESYAAQLLQEVLNDQGGEIPTYSREDDMRACGGFQFEIDQGGMTGGVCDLQAKFDLNKLVKANGSKLEGDEIVMNQFRRLIAAVDALDDTVEIDRQDIDVIVESTVDWLDPDTEQKYSGAEADYYTALQPPYRAANTWFTSASELRAVRGVTPEIYAALAPYITALPVGSTAPLNFNTASIPIYMSLGDDVTLANAENWAENTLDEPVSDTTQFKDFVDQAMLPYIGYSSSYFELRGLISIGTSRLGMYSLLEYANGAVVPRLRQFDVVDSVPVANTDVDGDERTGDTESDEGVDESDE